MDEAIGPEALIVDDTGFLTDGDASACVARQYTRTAGKVTDCQVGVSGRHTAHSGRCPARPTGLCGHRAPAEDAVPRACADREGPGHRSRPDGGPAGVLAGRIPAGQGAQWLQAHVLAIRRPAHPPGRTRCPQGRRRSGAARAVAAGRMAGHRAGTGAVLAVEFALRHAAGHPGAAGQAPLAHRREMKQGLGLAHFEGRTWAGWHHHVTLVSVAHALCTLQRLASHPRGTGQA
nr:transposase [Streptomyces ambofaciens]